MSTNIHGCCSGTVIEEWKIVTPPSGKSFSEMKLKLDDKEYSGKRYEGRKVAVRSYQTGQWLTTVSLGQRVFVTGDVEAEGYLSREQKPMGALKIKAQTVSVEGVAKEPDGGWG